MSVKPRRPVPAAAPRRSDWLHWLPGLETLREYQSGWLRQDIFAGLVLTTMLVPVGIAYASASGMPGVCGLYATILPLLAYAFFGPSRILVLGPDSGLAPLILAVVLPLAAGDPNRAIALGGVMAIGSGVICLTAGFARLGFVTELLSKPIRYGYMNGIALTVLLSQTPKMLGFSVTAKGPLRQAIAIVQQLLAGRANLAAAAIGVGTLLLILLLKRYRRTPGLLTAVLAATLIVAAFDLDARAGVAVLGQLPQGLPKPNLPLIPWADLPAVLTGALAVALVAFADTSVLSRTYAARLRRPVDPNQEMMALGAANLAAGFFQGFPISSSSSRTPVAEAGGAKTQLASVVGAVAIALLLLFAPNLLQFLPQSALAAVVIAAAVGLFEVADLLRIYRAQRWEFWLSMVCFAGVAIFGAIPGITIAIVIAVIEFLWDGWRPHSAVLGRVDHVKGFHDITRYPGAQQLPGLVMLRWDAPLFFANAQWFRERVHHALARAHTPVHWLVVAAEPVTSIDVTAADTLAELDDELRTAGVQMCFAEMKDPVKDKLHRFGLFGRFEGKLFATLDEAVDAYLEVHHSRWTRGVEPAGP
ncbi:MAG: STAS domain-containing protein [Proteobacteria bacterium]|nr:STAS domain-containing protein [Pseudomonadota bacterium]